MILDGRILKVGELRDHLATLQWNGFAPKFPVLHNTSIPDELTYKGWVAAGKPSMPQWLHNLASYYAGMGWNSMPHAFVLPDGTIGLGAPFNIRGTHSPSWNSISIGVETLGEFEREPWANTLTEMAAVALFGELCNRLNWRPDLYARGVSGVHFHREDPNTTHRTCPGKNVDKARFVSRVLAYMGDSHAATETDRNGHADVPPHVQVADATTLTKLQLTSALWVQQQLVRKGFVVNMDGVIGESTRKAVLAFQKANPPLHPDGIAGPLTRIALFK